MDGFKHTLNWYAHKAVNVSYNITKKGQDALNDYGKQIYTQHKDLFSKKCGDQYISKYQDGGLLLMSIVLNFDSEIDQEDIDLEYRYFEDIGKAIKKLNDLSKYYNTHGSVQINAF